MAMAERIHMAPRRRWLLIAVVTLAALIGAAGFTSLGVWQVQRLHWKLDLIERVDERVHAAPVAAPGPGAWPDISAERDEYRHVSLTGTFRNDDEVLIYTPSAYGPAYWVLTPLDRDDGTVIMINRGLVPEEFKDAATRPAPEGTQTVNGLLRISESKGWLFSRQNNPEERLWYRRDIGSITQALGLVKAAPYFVDADEDSAGAWPLGGQTVVSFRNAHLSYALTWAALALMCVVAWGLFIRVEWRRK